MTDEIFRCESIQYRISDREILKGVDLSLPEGKVIGCLGRNGSGKSTLLSICVGNYPLQQGQLYFKGAKVEPLSSRYRSRIGVVFQKPSLDGKLSALQNLQLAARVYGLSHSKNKIDDALNACGLFDRARDLVGTFSGGMKRRLDIARALLHQPSLLFLDEPTAGLDEVAYRETWSALNSLRRSSAVTIFVVTHRAEEAEQCDSLAILSEGKIVAFDTPAALRATLKSDVVVVKAKDHKAAREKLRGQGAEAELVNGDVVVPCNDGHLWIPRIFDVLGSRDVESVSLRKASLADAFLKITGSQLASIK